MKIVIFDIVIIIVIIISIVLMRIRRKNLAIRIRTDFNFNILTVIQSGELLDLRQRVTRIDFTRATVPRPIIIIACSDDRIGDGASTISAIILVIIIVHVIVIIISLRRYRRIQPM